MANEERPKNGEIVARAPASLEGNSSVAIPAVSGWTTSAQARNMKAQQELVREGVGYISALVDLNRANEVLVDQLMTARIRRDNRLRELAQHMLTSLTVAETQRIKAEIEKLQAEAQLDALKNPPPPLLPPAGPSKSKLEKKVAVRQTRFDELSTKLAAYRSLPENKIHELSDAEYHQVQSLENQLVESEKNLREARSELEDWIIENEA